VTADSAVEEHVIGALMLAARAIDDVLDEGLHRDDFYRGSLALMYDAACQMYAENVPVDALTLAARLDHLGWLQDAGGTERIKEIATLVPTSTNVRHYARIVIEQSTRRRIAAVGEQIHARALDPTGDSKAVLADVEGLVYGISDERRRTHTVDLRTVMDAAYDRAERAHTEGKSVTGLASGFTHLDNLTVGFQPGNLVVVAARPSVGKTAFALAITTRVIREHPVAFFTMEMSENELADRIICAEASVDGTKLRTGSLNADEWGRVIATTARVRDLPLLIEPGGALTAVELRSRARRLKLRNRDLALVVVDYLQLMTSGTRTGGRTEDVSAISRALKMLAVELNIPVIAVSQLSRQVEARHEKRPMLSDLRESGQIEADADLVIFLYRDEVYNPEDADELGTAGICEVIIGKHRNGPLGTAKLAFVKKFAKFSNLQQSG